MYNVYNKIILYDDKNLMYCTGNLYNTEISQDFKTCRSITGETWTVPLSRKFEGTIDGDETETIKLDETLMKRIARYNKEAEIKKYDKIIAEKKIEIQELDNILQDKEKRVEKIKEFVANIYDLDLADDEDEYYDY